jgi:hypothetical protein
MGYETHILHEAVADKIRTMGSKYWREVRLGYSLGIVDFITFHQGHYLVIECKNSCKRLEDTVLQVLQYAYLLHPEGRVPPDVITAANVNDVEVRGIIGKLNM